MDEGEGNDQLDQFHGNEAISAVADEAFMGDEDEDYEDLYNDVNVGEGFFQSMRGKSEAVSAEEAKIESPIPPPPALVQIQPKSAQESGVSIPGVGGGGGEGNVGFRGNEIGSKGGIRVELGPSKVGEFEDQSVGVVQTSPMPMPPPPPQQQQQQPPPQLQVPPHIGGIGMGNGGGGPGTILFVGDLHWWTTDAELETELCKYGQVKEVKFFDEKASGKSKGYCQVEFYDPAAATACKDGMNGYVFNGRPCVVAFASPFSVKRMGEAQVNRSQQTNPQSSSSTAPPARRGPNDLPMKPSGGNNIATGGNYQGGGDNNNNNNNNRGGFGRGNWGRGNAQGMGNRGGPVGPMRNRGGGAMGGRGIMGNGGGGFGQGPPMMHPGSMMGQGFDPSFGGPMGRMGTYGGFPGAPAPPFSGILSSFPPVGGVGLPGVAPHVNPAFFGRGMPMNGMGMMPSGGVDGPNMGMWPDPSMGSWGGGGGGGGGGDDHGGGRVAESSYEEAVSDHQYGEVTHDRGGGGGGGGWNNTMKEKDRGSERDWSGSSDRRYREERDQPREKDTGHEDWPERRHRDDRDAGRERERERDRERERSRDRDRERDRGDREKDRERHNRDDRDRYAEHHRYKEREVEHDDEWDRGRSSRNHSKGRDDDHRSRSRDADYGKRRRLTSE